MYNNGMETISKIGQRILDVIVDLGVDILIIVGILLIAQICVSIFSKITKSAMDNAEKLTDEKKAKKIKTSMTVTHSANRYIVYAIALFLIIKEIGLGEDVSTTAILAGAGGLIISLGAQSIVKDMVAGLFLMFEKQYYVGEFVKINNYEGTVTSIAIRVTYLDCAGKRVIIPNGEIKDVVNYSRTNNLAIITIPTSYEADTRKIIKVMQDVVDKYYDEHRDILTDNKPVVPGISSLEDSSVNITFRVETKPLKHWEVQRDLLLLIKEEFARKKIEIPYNQLVITKK